MTTDDELLVIDVRRALECRKEDIPGNELPGFVGAQLTDRLAVPRDDEAFPKGFSVDEEATRPVRRGAGRRKARAGPAPMRAAS
jgi:hypothetical protein